MAQVCPRCRRTNPEVAAFCYFDGMPLRADALAPAGGDPRAELAFPSGRHCHGLDELLGACQNEWDDAGRMLERGDLGRYLAKLGRADLVRAADEARQQPDRDVALYNFLSQLPAGQGPAPRLDIQPRRFALGKGGNLNAGVQHQFHVLVANAGKGVLQGKVTVSEGGEWLKVGGGDEAHAKVKTQRDQRVLLRADTRGLIGGQTYSGKLVVVTNGGIAEVPVRLDLKAVPFPQAPYQGAVTPRDLAQRMLANPKPAVPLLESGEVARWFTANGWNYPVPGDTAKGVAAVQQFFECLGLSKPPPLQLSDYEMRLQCLSTRPTGGQVVLRTPSRKWVYAQVSCSAPFLTVNTPSVSGGQQATIAFEVDPRELAADQTHQAVVEVCANGNQRLALRVTVEVRKPPQSAASRFLRPVAAGALLGLVLRLLLIFPTDLFARLLASRPGVLPKGTLSFWTTVPGTDDAFLFHFVLASWWLGGLAGMGLVWKRGGKWSDVACGLIAGSGAGLAGCGVLGCLLVLFDALPRAVLSGVAGVTGTGLAAGVATLVWLLVAVGCWAVLGGIAGVMLAALGRRGARGLAGLTALVAWMLRLCGLTGLAGWLAPR